MGAMFPLLLIPSVAATWTCVEGEHGERMLPAALFVIANTCKSMKKMYTRGYTSLYSNERKLQPQEATQFHNIELSK